MLNNYYSFRDDVVQALREDLLGPTEEEESIADPPATRYSVGILFPLSDESKPDTSRENIREDYEEDKEDPPVSLANVRLPSTMGITFAVDVSKCAELNVVVTAARYRPAGEELTAWTRSPLGPRSIPISVSTPASEKTETGIPGLSLYYRVREADENGSAAVTIVLLNILPSGGDMKTRDANSFFQPTIQVKALEDSEAAIFVERPSKSGSVDDQDLRAYSLLYRHAREFAVGHGCSVTWTASDSGPERAIEIRSEYIPVYRLPLADSNPNIDVTKLSMRRLSEGPRLEVCSELETFCGGYKDWIARQRVAMDTTPELAVHSDIAEKNLGFCEEASQRINAGIALLRTNDAAWESFVTMNRAMLAQRAQSEWVNSGKETASPILSENHIWRPFQIAFILMCLQGIAEPSNSNSGREIADLLWFPTGGGKTEAYLGLIAFAVFHRRLINADGGGVTALMRYTLRLLTIQQFERAAVLICACEVIRRESRGRFGAEPITLGVWLGRDATPLTLADTQSILARLMAGSPVDTSNPVQLQNCPWCGVPLDHRNYWIRNNPPKMVINCKQAKCAFGKELPVFLIDEDVYRYRPTLVIATVDKFASMPWKEDCGALFNRTGGVSTQPPPELIIQDELHLISGPLGTLTGLYETAVDVLSTQNGIRPKIIASTATIRRAADQSKRLFNREMRQFPPSGLDARDSYFAVESDPDKKGDRMYVGLMSPSTSHATLLVRTYAALLQSIAEIPASDEIKDQYWTLVGYFNSLRVLGGARMQVQDDVEDRRNLISAQRGTEPRAIEPATELTSRVPAREIPVALKQLAIKYPDAVDVLLATNMISVGVDVERLGLMAVMGQPQSTSEYIQCTSRVGRKFPGLVITMYNGARSRDRSHYESFVAHHSALYRRVESTSVTPFSARARDRALHAAFIAIARLTVPALHNNGAAAAVDQHRSDLDAIKETIVARVMEVMPREASATDTQINRIIDDWVRRSQAGPLLYSHFSDPTQALLRNAADSAVDDSFSTLWSMRDVDQESNLFYIG